MSLLICNVTLFENRPGAEVASDRAVVVEGTRIAAIGGSAEMVERFPGAEKLDGGGRLLMPGLINAHMHFYGAFARGLALPDQPRNFLEILQKLWWRLDRALDPEAVYHSALIGAISAVKNGCSAVIDHHASPSAVDGSLDRIEEALALVGLRGILCYEVSDRDGKEVRDLGLRENERYLQKCHRRRQQDPDHPFCGMMGLHAAFTLDDDSLERAKAIADSNGCGCHIHLLEDAVDEAACLKEYRRGPVERLHHVGLLGPRSIAAHGVHLSDADIDIVAESGTVVTHQAQSNMNNAVGRADVFELLTRGICVGIGTDGMTSDVRSEARTGYLLHKHHLADPNAGWNEFQTMLLQNNPAIYRRLSGQAVGRIEVGSLADLILVDYFPPTRFTGGNLWGHFLYGIVDAFVNTTIIHGKIVMRDRKLPNIDEQEIAAASRLSAEKVWKRFQT